MLSTAAIVHDVVELPGPVHDINAPEMPLNAIIGRPLRPAVAKYGCLAAVTWAADRFAFVLPDRSAQPETVPDDTDRVVPASASNQLVNPATVRGVQDAGAEL